MQRMSMKKILSWVWIAAFTLLLFSQEASDADLILVGNVSGSGPFSSSSMHLGNSEGGSLGEDMGDQYWFIQGEPPFSSANWLRIYSDQNNQYYEVTGYELSADNRPFSGLDANHNFPLILDTQGPDMVTSSDNYIRFELESAIDDGREFYQWDLTLYNGATFSDGSTYQSGVWDLTQDTTYDLPYYNLSDVQGIYGTLNVTPIPEPFTVGLLAVSVGMTNSYSLDMEVSGISSGREYTVQFSEDLSTWLDVTNIYSSGRSNNIQAIYETSSDKGHLRIKRQPSAR